MLDPNLMKAILAMDSYNRGYAPSIKFGNLGNGNSDDSIGIKIGNASIYATSREADSKPIGFYGIAYNYDGETVVSYRGTDSYISNPFLESDVGSDIWNGWFVGSGSTNSKQARMAIEFYQNVAEALTPGNVNYRMANISLNGHSLGGGLAGFVAGLYGKSALAFDNMPFELAVKNTLRVTADSTKSYYDLPLKDLIYGSGFAGAAADFSHIRTEYVPGEILGATLHLRDLQTTPQTPISLGTNVILPDSVGVDEHSMATLLIAKYATTNVSASDWKAAAQYFWPVMYDHTFAQSIGMGNIEGTLKNGQKYADILRMLIAYSAIDEGTRIFGDTGIKALYNDANDLGSAVAYGATNPPSTIKAYGTDISKAFVQYAGELALNKVLQKFGPPADPVLAGVLTYANAVNNHTLTVDFSDATWKAANGGVLPLMVARDALADHVLSGSDAIADYRTMMLPQWGTSSDAAIGKVTFALGEAGATVLTAAAVGKAGMFVGGSGIDTVTGSAKGDLILGEAGDDVFKASRGNDIFDGGSGYDTIDYSGLSGGLTLGASFAGENYTPWISIVKSMDGSVDYLGHVERIIGTAGNDVLAAYGRMTIDGGGGVNTGYLSGEAYVDATGAVDAADRRYLNFQNFSMVGSDLYISALGHNYDINHSGTLNIDYSGAVNALSFNGGGASMTVTSSNGVDTLSVSAPNVYWTGSNKGDTVSNLNFNIWLGRGNDIVNAVTRGSSITYSGGNDIVRAGSDGLIVNFDSSIQASAIHIGVPTNIVATADKWLGQTIFKFDQLVTIDGRGTLLLQGGTSIGYPGNQTAAQLNMPGGSTHATPGDDVLMYSDHNGGSGNDSITNSGYLYGGAGNDTIRGGDSTDRIWGGAGDDIIYGNDNPSMTFPFYNMEELRGNDGNDRISGGWGEDVVDGGSGNDVLTGGPGFDYIYSGDGNDIFKVIQGSDEEIIRDFRQGADKIDIRDYGAITDFSRLIIIENGSTSHPLYISAENPYFSGPRTEIYLGDSQIILYGIEASQLSASDFIFSGQPDHSPPLLIAGLTVNGTSGSENLFGAEGDDIMFGNGGNDYFYGDDGNDIIWGGAGDDTLSGGDGNNSLHGGGGTDTYFGGLDGDTYYLAAGNSTIFEFDGTRGDSIVLPTNVKASDVTLTTIDGFNATLLVSNFGTVYIPNQIGIVVDALGNKFAYAAIETLAFADGTIVPLASLGVTYNGTSSDDYYRGVSFGAGINDTMYGYAGNDTFYGNEGDDKLIGGTGIDSLNGSTGDDTYIFQAGDSPLANPDTVIESENEGADTIKLTGGILPSNVQYWSDGQYLHIRFGTDEILATGWNAAGNKLGNYIEKLAFDNGTIINLVQSAPPSPTSGNDTIDVSSASAGVTINLLAGNDSFTGSNFNDSVIGGQGNDIIEGRGGNDTLNGDAGIDTVTYASAASAVTVTLALTTAQSTSGAGTDTLTNFENLTGSAYNDTLTGNSGANAINGGNGNDVIDGGAGNDTLIGGSGTDKLSYAAATAGVTVYLATTAAQNTLGAGTDTISGFENLTGSAYNDTLTGDAGNNVIDGGNGLDVIQGGAGDDTLVGGGGADTLTYAASASGITVSLAVTTVQNTGGAGIDTISTFENLTGSSFADVLTGDLNANTINGGAGDDTIDGGAGNDVLNGGADTDWLSYASAASAVTVNLTVTTAQNTGGGGSDTVSSFENLTGSAYGDTLTGDGNVNILDGRAGADALAGGLGNDIYIWKAGYGADTLIETGGTEKILVSGLMLENLTFSVAGNDLMATSLVASADTLKLTGQQSGTAAVQFETMVFDDGFTLALTNYNRWTMGTPTNNSLYGDQAAGNYPDVIFGGGGNDTLKGYANNDTLSGDAGSDKLYGGAGNDLLHGGSGTDILYGEDGNDTLWGGAGADTLTGGAGNDRFIFDGSTASSDTIADFNVANDILDLSHLIVGFNPLTQAITNFVQITDNGSTSVVKVDLDGTGAVNTWTQVASLTAVTGLTDETALMSSGHLVVL